MIFLGDIHGEFKTFRKVLNAFPGERFGLVGDLVDRGPQSRQVVQFVMDNRNMIDCVRGNHEQMMLNAFRNSSRWGDYQLWMSNGGRATLESYGYDFHNNRFPEVEQQVLDRHLDFMESLPFYIEYPDLKDSEGRYAILSHSMIVTQDIQACVADQSICWTRHYPKHDVSAGKWFNIFGHTPLEQPLVTDYIANIDTGIVYGNALTAFRWPDLTAELFLPEK